MENISMSPFHCSEDLLNCCIESSNIPEKCIGYMFNTNCSVIEQHYKKLVTYCNKAKEKKNYTFPNLDNAFLFSSKKM